MLQPPVAGVRLWSIPRPLIDQVVRVKFLIAVTAAVLAVALTSTSAPAEGLNLSWDDCGTHGVQQRAFACDTNAGSNTIVGSFVAGAYLTAVTGAEAVMDLNSSSPALPNWWMQRTGSCRAGSLNGNFDFTAGPFNCFDYWQGGAIGAITQDPPDGNRVRIKGVFALPTDDSRIGPIAEGTEVYAFKAVITNARTTGLGACSGCDAGACIVFHHILLYQPPPDHSNYYLSAPADRQFVTWQCPGDIQIVDPGIGQFCHLDCPTPAGSRTWGQIKQLYR